MFTSLRSRLIGSYILIIVICLAVTGIVLTLLLVPQVIRFTYLRLADKSLPTALHVRSLRARGLTTEDIITTLKEQATTQGTRILIVTRDGRVLADTEDRWAGQQIGVSLQRNESERRRLYIEGRLLTREGLFFYVATSTSPLLRAEREETSPWYVVLLSPPSRVIASILGEITVGFILTGVVALLVSIGVALLIARSVAKPLQRVTTATEEMARGNYEGQLNITSPEEVRRLADSFNVMAQEVKASRQAQRDFVANVSHDLKTPLTSIQGFSQALLDGAAGDEESRRRAAQVIHEEADRVSRLVDDLLDLAGIEAGQVVMAQEPVPLANLLQGCMEKMALRAEQAEVALALEMDDNPIVKGDRDRLAQVFTNLLDNALNHTPPGGRIVLAVKSVAEEARRPGQEPETLAQITVADTGVGIPPEELSRIFERFYRGDKSRTKEGRGAGLGLAIAKEIIQAHGGRIKAESVVGLGTKFTITLPQSGDSGSSEHV
jgi:two-component system OmpR family sensor kinase